MKKFQKSKLRGGSLVDIAEFISLSPSAIISALTHPYTVSGLITTVGTTALLYIAKELVHRRYSDIDMNAHSPIMPSYNSPASVWAHFFTYYLADIPTGIFQNILRKVHSHFVPDRFPLQQQHPTHQPHYPQYPPPGPSPYTPKEFSPYIARPNVYKDIEAIVEPTRRKTNYRPITPSLYDISSPQEVPDNITMTKTNSDDFGISPLYSMDIETGKTGFGRRINKRGIIVSQVMKKYKISLGQASRFVKENNLY
jgi:hypothetical protein